MIFSLLRLFAGVALGRHGWRQPSLSFLLLRLPTSLPRNCGAALRDVFLIVLRRCAPRSQRQASGSPLRRGSCCNAARKTYQEPKQIFSRRREDHHSCRVLPELRPQMTEGHTFVWPCPVSFLVFVFLAWCVLTISAAMSGQSRPHTASRSRYLLRDRLSRQAANLARYSSANFSASSREPWPVLTIVSLWTTRHFSTLPA